MATDSEILAALDADLGTPPCDCQCGCGENATGAIAFHDCRESSGWRVSVMCAPCGFRRWTQVRASILTQAMMGLPYRCVVCGTVFADFDSYCEIRGRL